MTAPKSCPACGEQYATDVLFCPKDGTPLVTSRIPSSPGGDGDAYLGMDLPGQIKLRSLIGIGSMGRVYRAFQAGIERDVAVKVLHRELSHNQELVSRFHREAKIASRLVHANVVQVLMTGTLPFTADPHVGGELYLVMEYLDGISLLSAIAAAGGGEGEALPLPRALHIVLQICEAVGEAHVQGIVHRDLKPENVMLVRRGEDLDYVKVLDFGIARLDWKNRSISTQQGLIFGTAKYISPEGAEGRAVGPAADVYAIATILYQCLSGRTPFSADSPVALLVQQTQAIPDDLRSIPRASYVPEPIAKVVMQNLAKQPEARAQDALELGRDLLAAARASGLAPESLVAQSGLVSTGKGVLKLPSKQRTKALALTPDVVAQIAAGDDGVTVTPTPTAPSAGATLAAGDGTAPGVPLGSAGASRPSGTEVGASGPTPRAAGPTFVEDDEPESAPRSRRSYPPRARRSYGTRAPGTRSGTRSGASPDDGARGPATRSRAATSQPPEGVERTMPGEEHPGAEHAGSSASPVMRWLGVAGLILAAGGVGLGIGHLWLRDRATGVDVTVELARDAMTRHAWHAPTPDNVEEILTDASERWPNDPRVVELRREAAERVLTDALARKYAGDRAEALLLARLALDLDPGLTVAQRFVAELSGESEPEVAPVAEPSADASPASTLAAPRRSPGGASTGASGALGSGALGSGSPGSGPPGSGPLPGAAPAPGATGGTSPVASVAPSPAELPPEPTEPTVGPAVLPPPPPALPADHQPPPGSAGGPWL